MSEFKRLLRLRQGTSFKGYLLAQYSDIVATFGEPTRAGDNDKTDAEWIINTPHGVATIYNYKDGHSYLGEAGLDTDQIIEWHVGSKNTKGYEYVYSKVTATVIGRIG